MNLWEWMPINEAAKLFRVAPRWLKALADSRSIDSIRVEGVAVVWLNDLAQYQRDKRQNRHRRPRRAMFFESLLNGQE